MSALSHNQINYAGFWRRLLAFLLDTILLSLISTGLAIAFFGLDYVLQLKTISDNAEVNWPIFLLDQVLPAIWTISFWLVWKATPAKLLFDCQILDASSFQKANIGQLILRYLCYIISALPLGLGFIWIAVSKRNQGWHDKLSNTVVILQDESLIEQENTFA